MVNCVRFVFATKLVSVSQVMRSVEAWISIGVEIGATTFTERSFEDVILTAYRVVSVAAALGSRSSGRFWTSSGNGIVRRWLGLSAMVPQT